MNRYQGMAIVGGIAVFLVVVILVVWAVYLARERAVRRARVARLRAIREAKWGRVRYTKGGITYFEAVRMARWGQFQEERVDSILVGSVMSDEPDWPRKMAELEVETDARVFQLNLESLG
jgi:hypothetical protein